MEVVAVGEEEEKVEEEEEGKGEKEVEFEGGGAVVDVTAYHRVRCPKIVQK